MGFLNSHPFKKEVRFEGEAPRTRYVTDEEIVECLAPTSMRKKGPVKVIQAYIKIKLLTGMDCGDLLRLQMQNVKDDGIHNQPQDYEEKWQDDHLRMDG